MFRNYVKIAFRNLMKSPGYAAINITGLAIGIACCVLILMYVLDELSYDRFHADADRIYRVVEIIEGAEESSSQPFPVGPALAEDFSHLVASSVRFFNMQAPTLTVDYEPPAGEVRRYNEPHFFFVDSTFFDVFDFALVRGDAATALARPNTVLLTESTARRYFGEEDPIGKTLRVENQMLLEVTGVLADLPTNVHFRFDFLASFSSLRAVFPPQQFTQNWYWNPCWTYVLLQENVRPDALEAQFAGFVQQYFPQMIKDQTRLYLQPLTDIHLHSHLDFEIAPNSDIAYVYIFSAIAFFVLLIACINFMNLATARSAKRAREVGMRKVLGAQRVQLVRQFLGESLLLSLLAVLVAIPLIWLALPVLNGFAGKALSFSPAENGWIWLGMGVVALLVGVVSGAYPALFLSAYNPTEVLKGTIRLGGTSAATVFRKVLVVSQFAISIILIAGTIVAYDQLGYMRDARLGFDKEQVVLMNMQLSPIPQRYDELRERLLQYPGVRNVSVAEEVPGKAYQTYTIRPEGTEELKQYQRLMVMEDFIETMGIEMAAGRSYQPRAYPTDETRAIVINEAMVRQLGWGSAEEAVGKRIYAPNDSFQTVIGVAKDFHSASLHQPIGPFVLQKLNQGGTLNFFGRYLVVRLAQEDVQGTMAHIERVWAEFAPNRPFSFFFLDDDLDALYKAEETLGKVATAFAVLAILVACLGLFGLASFMTEQRRKEIGVRKTMGATVPGIVLLLSKEFARLVVVAFVVAAPLAWFAFNSWLDNFAYRTSIHPAVFVVSGLLALLVALGTVSYQTVRAALTNPINALRYE